MTEPFERRLIDLLGPGLLAKRLPSQAESFFEHRSKDRATSEIGDPLALGLARVLAASAATSRYLAHREPLLARLARADAGALERRSEELARSELAPPADDLETGLDHMRLLRRDETAFVACLELAGLVSNAEGSVFLSRVAEWCLRRALELAERRGRQPVAAIGMGKIAGRELTYQSDLDLIFVHEGEDGLGPARCAQKIIAYLATMTGAGVAYEVDSRLRPSGRQGTLVTEIEAFERYQTDRAATWEHLALMRARAVVGDVELGQRVLDRSRARVIEAAASPWPAIAEMRGRVEQERGRRLGDSIPLKTGRGGLMDVEFLATGAELAGGTPPSGELPPAIPTLLRRHAEGPTVDALLRDYAYLRRVEALARFAAGHVLEALPRHGELAAVCAELIEPGAGEDALLAEIDQARERIRRSFERVIAEGSVGALC